MKTKREGIEIAKRLNFVLNRVGGLGLAANQIGVLRRVCIVRAPGLITSLINPVILRHSDRFIKQTEECLSFPGETVETFRWTWVEISADNLRESKIVGVQFLEDFRCEMKYQQTVVLQHEVAHTRSMLHFDFQEARHDNWGKA